jgi:hypothetical protein
MKNYVAAGQVEAQDKAQATALVTDPVRPPLTPPVGGQPESRPEWFGKGGRTFLSADKKLMAGWKTRHPLWETDKTVKGIMKKRGV